MEANPEDEMLIPGPSSLHDGISRQADCKTGITAPVEPARIGSWCAIADSTPQRLAAAVGDDGFADIGFAEQPSITLRAIPASLLRASFKTQENVSFVRFRCQAP